LSPTRDQEHKHSKGGQEKRGKGWGGPLSFHIEGATGLEDTATSSDCEDLRTQGGKRWKETELLLGYPRDSNRIWVGGSQDPGAQTRKRLNAALEVNSSLKREDSFDRHRSVF